MYFMGLYTSPRQWQPTSMLGRILLATILGSLTLGLILFAGNKIGILPPFSRAIVLFDAGLSFGLVFAIRAAAYGFRLGRDASASGAPLAALKLHWGQWLREGAIYFGIVGGSLAAYMLWNQLAFGTSSPVSGQIKRWWGTFAHSIYGNAAPNWLTFFAANPFSDFNAWGPPTTWLSDLTNGMLYSEGTGFGNPTWRHNFVLVLVVVCVAVGLVLVLGRRKTVLGAVQTSLFPLFVGSWLQIMAYNIPGYASPKEWYWLTEPVTLVILGSLVVNSIIRAGFMQHKVAQVILWILVAWYSGRGAFIYCRDAYYLSPYGAHPAGTPYSDIIPFLESHTEPGAIIGMTGGGNVGYLMPSRTIVNMDGLINSNEYFLDLQAGTSADYLYQTGMRYVFANPTLLESNPYRGQYTSRLKRLVDWGGKDLLRLLPGSGP